MDEFDASDLRPPPIDQSENLGNIIGQRIQTEVLSDQLIDEIVSEFTTDVVDDLGIEEVNDFDSLMQYLDYFTYNQGPESFFEVDGQYRGSIDPLDRCMANQSKEFPCKSGKEMLLANSSMAT